MPKTYGRLYNRICEFGNLHQAYLKARRNKRYRAEVLAFSAHLEEELLQLQQELLTGTYHTGTYRRFEVREPKRRLVAALPFRDRVVQHALYNIIEPIFESRFIHDSYACREGKGTHAGADRVTAFLRKAHREHGQVWILKGDIAHYFPSVDHQVLLAIIERTIRCDATMGLVREIVDSWHTAGARGRGIPIGNLTSQLFANLYLNELDQFVKHELRQRHYARYMDDFVVIGGDKAALNGLRQDITEFLAEKLALGMNSKTKIFAAAQGVDFLGYRIWATHRLLRKGSIKRMKHALRHFIRLYAGGDITLGRINASVQSWLGHCSHADTYNLRKRLLAEANLTHGSQP
jgi:retron-type reverse transcriptase